MGLVSRCVLSVVLATGCLPAAHEYLGGACDTAHPCPGTLECRSGICLRPGSAAGGGAGGGGSGGGGGGGGRSRRDNRIPEGTFEGGMLDFTFGSTNTLVGDNQTVRTGFFAAKLTGPGPHTLTTDDFRVSLPGTPGLFCAEAWVTGAGSATVTLGTTRSIDGPLTSADRPESHATLSASWAPVRTRIVVDTQTIDIKWTLRVDQPGQATWVDDLMVWPSADGSCAE